MQVKPWTLYKTIVRRFWKVRRRSQTSYRPQDPRKNMVVFPLVFFLPHPRVETKEGNTLEKPTSTVRKKKILKSSNKCLLSLAKAPRGLYLVLVFEPPISEPAHQILLTLRIPLTSSSATWSCTRHSPCSTGANNPEGKAGRSGNIIIRGDGGLWYSRDMHTQPSG